MTRLTRRAVLIVLLFLASLPRPARADSGGDAAAADACERLTSLALADGVVTAAQVVEAGAFTPPAAARGSDGNGGIGGNARASANAATGAAAAYGALPAFCRVTATLTPSRGSGIAIEVWLPAATWNGKFQAVGNRGWGGSIGYPALGAAVAAGYAAAATDTGHTGSGARFALQQPEKVIDAGSRAVHAMTVQAKTIIAAFYDRAPARSYWNGCSLGGRQGLAEAQRYPEDYDGIIAGDAANDVTHLYAARLAVAQAIRRAPGSEIPVEAFPLIHTAVLAACDALDGVTDGVIEDPTRCRVEPALQAIACKGDDAPRGDAPSCLTAPQIESARALYAPVAHPKTGALLAHGREPGSELGWSAVAGPQPENNAVDLFAYVIFGDAGWDWRAFDLARDVDTADRTHAAILNATDANLAAFFARGGKLLLYHGWADPQTPPRGSIDYYQRVVRAAGAKTANRGVRLFMAPGMGHCEGGDGPDRFDKVAALDAWVETGAAPARIVASRVKNGAVDRTRPLCPYGAVARWNGAGSTDDAASFTCVIPADAR
jgi:feruloyl esterase